jgi:hypothetical protein
MLLPDDGRSMIHGEADPEQLEAALETVGNDRSPRVEELAQNTTAGQLLPEENQEYAEIVRLTDMRSLLKLQAEAFSRLRAAS